MTCPKRFESLKIRLDDIKEATGNFSCNNYISKGGFGRVYKGQLLDHSGRKVMVAVKRLDRELEQGTIEFMQEIHILSLYKHANIISLIGFCTDDGENILVYEYLPNKSLDVHLKSPNLLWIDRLHICIGVARGLKYLHKPRRRTKERVLHRDIKSPNILLDLYWNAKISDFGLSKLGPANKDYSFILSRPAGTSGYHDPYYATTNILKKESDIYSFGVVLFEVLCGKLAMEIANNGHRRLLSDLARRCYEENRIDSIVLDCLLEQISPCCLEKFSKLAYQCLEKDPEKRPLITEIVKELRSILRCQIVCDALKDKKLSSHALFQLIENPKAKMFMENQWLYIKEKLN